MREVTIVTGTRAEYGLLKNVCKIIAASHELSLSIIATGSHLSSLHGSTLDEILDDGFSDIKLINLKIADDSAADINRYVACAIEKFSAHFSKKKPDLLLILGDRYEIFGVAVASMFLGIPIAHIHGGELTEGAFDDVIRHSLTKMSYLHFTSTLEYRNRVIQLGENPKLVFNVGGLGAAAISNIKTDLLDKHSLEDELGFKFNKKNLFVTYHPETLSPDRTLSNLIQLLAALDEINGTNIIFSMPNADTGFRDFFEVVEGFVSKKQSCRKVFQSLGQLKYFSCLKYVDAVIGNSSSGILEAPSFKIGTINIGDRQKGRVRADSVIDVSPIKSEILKAIDFLYTAEFQSTLTKVNNPYFKPNTAESIVKILECTELSNLKKSFFDIETKEIFTAHNMQPKTSQNIDSQ